MCISGVVPVVGECWMTMCTRRLLPSPKELMAWYGKYFALLLVAQNDVCCTSSKTMTEKILALVT